MNLQWVGFSKFLSFSVLVEKANGVNQNYALFIHTENYTVFI